MEDAISMLTIVFVLFVIFLVPLVSIDKARLEDKLHDKFWNNMVVFLDNNNTKSTSRETVTALYDNEFDIHNAIRLLYTVAPSGSYNLIEFLGQDSSVTIIKHNLSTNRFNSMRISAGGTSTTFRHGELQTSA